MDSTLLAAVIGAIATVAAVVIGWLLQRQKIKPVATSQIAPPANDANGEAPRAYARRYLEYPGHYRFVKSLPKLKAVVLENAQEGWDTGVTADTREASYDMIGFLEYAWLRLAQFYPDKHWTGRSAEDYIRSYIQDRFSFHWSKHEPDGPGMGGTIIGVLTGGDVISDLEDLIADTVSTLFIHNKDFDFRDWRKGWKGTAGDV